MHTTCTFVPADFAPTASAPTAGTMRIDDDGTHHLDLDYELGE